MKKLYWIFYIFLWTFINISVASAREFDHYYSSQKDSLICRPETSCDNIKSSHKTHSKKIKRLKPQKKYKNKTTNPGSHIQQ